MATRTTLKARRHAIAAGHPLAAQAGLDILEAGGNAVDAGVCAGMVLGVVHSDLVSFAGVAPILMYLADSDEVVSVDGLGVWPRAASVDYFLQHHAGAIPAGIQRSIVPGAPSAWITALDRYGSMSFAEVAGAAIQAAREGFSVFELFARTITDAQSKYRRWESNRAIYLPEDRPPRVGENFLQRDLATTLQYLVDEEASAAGKGRSAALKVVHDAFYKGDVAGTICDYHKANDGFISRQDMGDFRARFEAPLAVDYGGYRIYTCGAWSQGVSLAQAFSMLGQFDLSSLEHNSLDYIHSLSEILKLVFADRERYVGDPDFVDVPVTQLLSYQYAKARATLVNPTQAWQDLPPAGDPFTGQAIASGQVPLSGSRETGEYGDPHATRPHTPAALDTSYLAVMDSRGTIFSATPSDTSSDTEVIPGTGLAVSSRGSQSRGTPGHPNSLMPGKRPRLTPNPALALRQGRPAMVFGTPGGDVQIQAMLQVFLNITANGMNIQSAVDAPRFASYSFPSSFYPFESQPGMLMVEETIPPEVQAGLRNRGHRLGLWPEKFWQAGGVCAIYQDPDTGFKYAGADSRRACMAAGN